MPVKPPRVFMSYSWEPDVSLWTLDLSTILVRNGIDVLLDRWDVQPGKDLMQFMTDGISDSDFVLVVCTPRYRERSKKDVGGVGYERTVITGELFDRTRRPGKFIPLLRAGTPSTSIPAFLASRAFIDFREDGRFLESLDLLVATLLGAPLHMRPSAKESSDAEAQSLAIGARDCIVSFEQPPIYNYESDIITFNRHLFVDGRPLITVTKSNRDKVPKVRMPPGRHVLWAQYEELIYSSGYEIRTQRSGWKASGTTGQQELHLLPGLYAFRLKDVTKRNFWQTFFPNSVPREYRLVLASFEPV